MKRLMRHRRLIGLAFILMLLPLALSAPKAEASYTYVDDPTFSDIGWMDVKRVGWDFNPNELLLTVQNQANIPNNPNYFFAGYFYLDTDLNPATGSVGCDYCAYFEIQGDGSSCWCELYRWDAVSTTWVFVKNPGKPFFQAGGDTVELGIPLADIGSPTAINIYYHSKNSVYDYVYAKYTYNVASETRSITVDGNPADWTGDTPDVTDPSDTTLGWADATDFYTTTGSTATKLYLRMNLAATPLSLHPEENSYLRQRFWSIYFDTDHNPSTGQSNGGIGAEYYLSFGADTYHGSRTVSSDLYHWSGTSWTKVSGATLERAIDTCYELSVLLSDMGVTGSSVIDVYVEKLCTENNDNVPNIGTFTATKTTPPSKMLSEASASILSASANSVHFIYADPYRMVSSAGPWQAAFAAYDATAAGFLYGLCANTQRICFDSNASIVVAKSPESSPPFNYGKMLLSSKSVVVMGGPIPNWVVDYYERTGQTPLKYSGNATHHCFLTQAGDTVAALSASADFTHNDLFVVMVFQDTNANFVLLIYGLGWKGTFAGGIYFKEVIKPNLATYTKRAYVFRWTDAGPTMDGVPQAGEITKIYEWP